MSEEQVPYEKLGKPKKSKEITKRKPKKPHLISDEDAQTLTKIAEKAKNLRIGMNMSYEGFALKAGINRNSYFRFEKSAQTGNNFTVVLMLQVIRGLNMTPSQFFKDIK
jgi:DNA-binding XRE family transcriptional regulator